MSFFGDIDADTASRLTSLLMSRRAVEKPRRRIFLPVAASEAFITLARADGVVAPGWRIDGMRVDRVAATCWDYLAAGVWAVPALVKEDDAT